jgi:hypothetical protein
VRGGDGGDGGGPVSINPAAVSDLFVPRLDGAIVFDVAPCRRPANLKPDDGGGGAERPAAATAPGAAVAAAVRGGLKSARRARAAAA